MGMVFIIPTILRMDQSGPARVQLHTLQVMLFVASNASDWQMTTFTPSSSDQMIRNLSMKIGEIDQLCQQSG